MTDPTTTKAPTLSCGRCGKDDDLPPGPPVTESILKCAVCKARIAFGRLIPRVVVEPHADPRFVVVRFDSVEHVLDRDFAVVVAKNIASISGGL